MVSETYGEFLDLNGLVKYLGIHMNTFYRWKKTGDCPPFHRIGSKYLFNKSEVDEWVMRH